MLKPFKPRLIPLYAVSILLASCASNYDYSSHSPNSSRTDSSYDQSRSHSNDIWQRIRDNYQIPDLYNSEVASKENYYAQRADYVGRMANRSGDFLYLIMNEVERRKMPSEIALLPFVESAFVTTAQSPVKAAGLWQFMPATGRDFSLQQNRFVDQRNDVISSTDAALTFLQRLYDQFGDWQLALAAYNWGPGNVSKAVRRAQAQGLQGTYSDIKMPLETRQYVPKLQAIKNIINNPAQFGITLPNITNHGRHEIVSVTRDMDIATAARLSGLDIEEFKGINPAYKKSVIVASVGSKILVPASHANQVRDALRDKSQTLSSITTYLTYNTESLDDIASKFNTNADNLRYLNNIPSFHGYVKAGSAVLVPRTSNRTDQDIPYEALTAGLSTTSGGTGFSGVDYIEQPIILANNTDEASRPERSGIINIKSNGPGLSTNTNNNDDDLGLFIKNNVNTTSDPVRNSNTLVVGSSNSTSVAFAQPVTTVKPLDEIVIPVEKPFVNATASVSTTQATTSTLPVTVLPSSNTTPSSLVVTQPTAPETSTPKPPTTTPIITPLTPVASTENTNDVLKPFITTVTDTPEVIQEHAAPVIIKKVATPAKPKASTYTPEKPKVVLVNTQSKGKTQSFSTAKTLVKVVSPKEKNTTKENRTQVQKVSKQPEKNNTAEKVKASGKPKPVEKNTVKVNTKAKMPEKTVAKPAKKTPVPKGKTSSTLTLTAVSPKKPAKK